MLGGAGSERRHAAERLEARVVGDVQGVGFRWFVLREALGLDLVGWVANESDGSVAVMAEGLVESLDRLQSALAAGPPGARVEAVMAQRSPLTGGFARFEIRSGGHHGD
ncbi:MAG: acylphosphatase [Candidatus Limnocylindrales bacterium]